MSLILFNFTHLKFVIFKWKINLQFAFPSVLELSNWRNEMSHREKFHLSLGIVSYGSNMREPKSKKREEDGTTQNRRFFLEKIILCASCIPIKCAPLKHLQSAAYLAPKKGISEAQKPGARWDGWCKIGWCKIGCGL